MEGSGICDDGAEPRGIEAGGRRDGGATLGYCRQEDEIVDE